jgi:hypothetical protein
LHFLRVGHVVAFIAALDRFLLKPKSMPCPGLKRVFGGECKSDFRLSSNLQTVG